MMNILNGGAHADNNVDIQEFMITPLGAGSFAEGRRWGSRGLPRAEVRDQAARPVHGHRRRGRLCPGPRAQPGGARPDRRGDRQGRIHPGQDIALAIDAAASEFYADGAYNFEGKPQTSTEMAAIYAEWVDAYPLVSLEDPLAEEDWPGWQQLTATVGDRVQVVGDDLSSPIPNGSDAGSPSTRRTRSWSSSARSAR